MSVNLARTPIAQFVSIPEKIQKLVGSVITRIRLIRAFRYGSLILMITSLIAILVVILIKLRVLHEIGHFWYPSVIGGTTLLTVMFCLLQRYNPHQVARHAEQKADMKDRLSSAIELKSVTDNSNTEFVAQLISDAESHSDTIDLKKLYPIKVPKTFWSGTLSCVGLALVLLLPSLPFFYSKDKKQEVAEVKRQGIAIIKLAEETKKSADQQKLTETKKAAEEARKLGEEMKKGKLDKKQSLVELQKLTKKMEDTQKKMAESAPKKSMEEAKNQFKKSLEKEEKELQEAQAKKKLEAAQKGANPGLKPEKQPQDGLKQQESPEMKKMKASMKQMAEALADQDHKQMEEAMKKLAQQLASGKLSKAEMQKMQQSLNQLAKSLQGSEMHGSSEQLKQLAQMMAQGQGTPSAEKMAQMAQMAQQLAKGMGQGQASNAMFDAKAMAGLCNSLKAGRGMMAMQGKGSGKGRGGFGPGRGYGSLASKPFKAMKDPGNTKAKLAAIAMSQYVKANGKKGDAKQFAKYMSKTFSPPKHLPNGKVQGVRNDNGNEMQISMTGDPDSAKSNAPYYQVYSASKKAAESALNKESIPAAYKQQIRDYFESIKP